MTDSTKDQLKIKKPVQTLALIPRKGKLSVVARKLYNVILHSTINQIAEFELQSKDVPAEHLFECRLADLVQPIQLGQSDLRAKAKEYFQQMSEIRLDWEAPDAKGPGKWTNLGLLAEAQLDRANPDDPKSDVVARWAFPPTIFKELRHPEMYAQLSIYQIAKLSTYEAVALYEICARYRTNAAGVTSPQAPQWWVKALSNKVPDVDPITGEPKWREWRKFKDEKIKKAVKEISEQTDLDIELLPEKKEGVQFAVRRKASEFLPVPNRLNPEIAEAAIKLGLKLTDIASLIRNGQSEAGLRVAFAKMTKQDPANIARKLAYLNKILEEVNPLVGAGQIHVQPSPTNVVQSIASAKQPEIKMALSFKDERFNEIRKEFSLLPRDEQRPFAYSGLSELRAKKMANPSMSLKVEAGHWDATPVLLAKMVELYAVEKYGPTWGVEQA